MSPLRKLKACFWLYSGLPHDFQPRRDNFYQFALDVENTIKHFDLYGFKLLYLERMDGVKGLKDELFFLKSILQKIYDSRLLVLRGCKKIMDMMFKKYCGHSVLLMLELDEKA